ncbi:MAG: hypothetical protein IGR93_07050 [Hydrococcus sp. C42_A2020_068]|nr:hypothetical protein [Hydrococcus sp. C42_A2020_068]
MVYAATERSRAAVCWEKAELGAALAGRDPILNDEFFDYPEKSPYAIGTIDEAKKP